jgi:putative membrane protein
MELINLASLVNAILYSVMGLVLFVIGFIVVDRITPYHLWKEIIEEKNLALAVVIGAISVGICQIIAAAIHG